MWAQIIGSIAQLGFGEIGKREEINQANAEAEAQWGVNLGRTQAAMSTLIYRTSREQEDIRRRTTTTVLAATKAARKATGDAAVEAARMGVAGKRADLALATGAEREAANVITEAELAEEVELLNSTFRLNDAAQQLIDNLNDARPTYQSNKGFLEYFMDPLGLMSGDSQTATSAIKIGTTLYNEYGTKSTAARARAVSTSPYTGRSFDSYMRSPEWVA